MQHHRIESSFSKAEKRFGLTAVQKGKVWRRWKAGQTLHEMGRAFGQEHSSSKAPPAGTPPIR
jgi:hypothetical protein